MVHFVIHSYLYRRFSPIKAPWLGWLARRGDDSYIRHIITHLSFVVPSQNNDLGVAAQELYCIAQPELWLSCYKMIFCHKAQVLSCPGFKGSITAKWCECLNSSACSDLHTLSHYIRLTDFDLSKICVCGSGRRAGHPLNGYLVVRSTCRSFLGQDCDPQIAPGGSSISMWSMSAKFVSAQLRIMLLF